MNFVEIMVGEKLKDIDPTLDVMGSDRKVLQVACQDFTNYLKFHWNLIGKETNKYELVEKLEKQFHKNPAELEIFLTIWTTMWLKKWKERIKLLIGDQNQNKLKVSKTLSDAEPYWKKIDRKQELTEVVVGTLLKNGEICGTEILAENLLKWELGEKHTQNLNDKERIFSIVNNALRKAREVSRSKGPLIFVKIDKGYYSSE